MPSFQLCDGGEITTDDKTCNMLTVSSGKED